MAKRSGIDFSRGIRGRYHGKSLHFHLASTTLIDQLADLARELFSEVLEMSYDACLVTDESELHHFITDDTPDDYEARFHARYGFELSEVDRAPLVEILARIAAQRRTGGTPN